jgi:hypothetical protein
MVSKIYDIETEKIYSKGRRKVQVEARDLGGTYLQLLVANARNVDE